MAYRVYHLIEELKAKYPQDNGLFVTHGGVARIIHTYFHDVKNEEFLQYRMENGQVSVYEVE